MKTYAILIITSILLAINVNGQAPEKFNYQSIARDNAGAALANQELGLQISILDVENAEYVEIHTVTTNGHGLYTLAIGGGTPVTGTMTDVVWGAGNKSIKIEIDPDGGSNYSDLGTTELLSVPYALYAVQSANGGDPFFETDNDQISYMDTSNFGKPFLVNTDQINNSGGDEYKMMFLPSKEGAFRAGSIEDISWDLSNIGISSVAFGTSTEASGDYSTAMGIYTKASGDYSTALGGLTEASGNYSTAMGLETKASGNNSTAMGSETEASGNNSTAMGSETEASGLRAIAMGYHTKASGNQSTAIGYHSIAQGDYSTAIGSDVVVTGSGSMYLADNSRNSSNPDTRTSDNVFYGRFANGYYLYTTATGSSPAARLSSGANSWSTVSDSTKKENFLPVNGKQFLNKITSMKLTSWNYKGQDPKEFRHYGPIAQDFYNAFGNDEIGTIGNDTTIATADIDGVMMIAIQQLAKENDALKAELEAQQLELKAQKELVKAQQLKLKAQQLELKDQSAQYKKSTTEMEERLSKIETLIQRTEPIETANAKVTKP